MDCTASDERFLSTISLSSELASELPPDVKAIISRGTSVPNDAYLNALSRLALHSKYCSAVLVCYEPIFAELAARWRTFASAEQMAGGFGRVLPVVPYLAEMAEEFLLHSPKERNSFLSLLSHPTSELRAEDVAQLPGPAVLEVLLSLHRLLRFKRDSFIRLVDPGNVLPLLWHPQPAVRYLAIRILCIYLQASDAAQEEMFGKYGVGQHSMKVPGMWEGCEVDYGFLMVLECDRLMQLEKDLVKSRVNRSVTSGWAGVRVLRPEDFSQWVVNICGVLTPCLRGPPTTSLEIIDTPTTRSNIQALALSLRSGRPILLTGSAGTGKTFLVHRIAHTLHTLDSLVSIHLGDQTDAKLLMGAYTAADTPGSFEWRPGVLTTAVREGRWVLIEDIDKAPTEALSVLLPLIERGEIIIPSRGETVKAARGFRLITTIRSTRSSKPDHATANLLGSRLWGRVDFQMLDHSELLSIVNARFPLLHAISPSAMSVYDSVQKLYRDPGFFAISKTSLGRQISPRDLFKWCTRINTLFMSAGVKTGNEALPEGLFDEIFREAVDCFAGSLHTNEARHQVIGRIAEEMHVPLQRAESFLTGHVPGFNDSERSLVVGRARLKKRKEPTGLKRRKKVLGLSKRPFATTAHALRLLEQVGVAVRLAEPVLLVGETGTGKTTAVQYLADTLGYNLTVINLSQQTESGDLVGGYKPVDVRTLAIPLKEAFEDLFERTFSIKKNKRFLEMQTKYWGRQQWGRVIRLWAEAVNSAKETLAASEPAQSSESQDPAKKRRKIAHMDRPSLQAKWTQFSYELSNLERQASQLSKSFALSFVEGSLVKAARHGDWVLLDEINLAAPDTLESIADLLKDGGNGSILLSEKGDIERIQAHPDFRIFGCMNPATDVGKRDLPSGLRSRFTELYVSSPDSDFQNLLAIVKEYIGHLSIRDNRVCSDVSYLYLESKKLAEDHRLVDGANQRPHFSMRTLTRTLSYATEIAGVYGLRRSLYEGFCMSFLTLLDRGSERLLLPIIAKYILGTQKNARSLLSQIPARPSDGSEYVQFRHYWMHKGPYEIQEQAHYIITPFVERNMLNLVRATATRKFPVLIQGPTSSGKTSMIEYLAKRTGHKFVRINNHEHTDLQEYLGTYVSDNDGQLRFQEGILVEALRKGHWIVLDELNLAPTDVLEALNRLLDDNRELLIPETQEVVRPHKDFMLFATQNPPGLYGGRKNLSRAFRNRFLELHYDDIPEEELETILKERCQIAPSYGRKIVLVYKELSRLRQSTRLFEQKNSFATLRDLFRWANRGAVGYEELAEHGYMLLAERVRKDDEKLSVKKVIEKELRVKIDESRLYETTQEYKGYNDRVADGDVVWTKAMRRLFSLVAHALRNKEPVLLVGDTGCGKTTVCQMLAQAFGKTLNIVNAHQNTETGDIIGAQRPIRNRATCREQLVRDLTAALQCSGVNIPNGADLTALLQSYAILQKEVTDRIPEELKLRIKRNQMRMKALFEWADGSLVTAMKEGQFFLLDEISLADDSVLERLNSVLEPQRSLLLAEKGPDEAVIDAHDDFQFLATMNPGGDFGKKELSPALRNRFTEIWVGAMSDVDDIRQIVHTKLAPYVQDYTDTIVSFAQWFSETYRFSAAAGTTISIRDILAWVKFMNLSGSRSPVSSLVQGAAMVFIDALGANPSAALMATADDLIEEKRKCIAKLSGLVGQDLSPVYEQAVSVFADESMLKIGEFALERKEEAISDISFNISSPTTAMNAMRVARALQLRKPILLEGSPGVGKTSLISALAAATGNPLTRINLSEQTDLMDLFGSDVPLEGGESGEFAWRDAAFLQAMQRGHWVLLDEMNLASQSILEGLNACLDHRGETYVAELDRTFSCHKNFAVFAAQNPHHQGGGRKGLPASFVNRFTVVYVDGLAMEDLHLITTQLFPSVPADDVSKLVTFVTSLDRELTTKRSFGSLGGPWEFNLRDTLRWLGLLSSDDALLASRKPEDFLDVIVKQRFRSKEDKKQVDKLFAKVFGYLPRKRHLYYQLSEDWFQVGHALLSRRRDVQPTPVGSTALLKGQLPVLETVMTCVLRNMPCILVGQSGVGKTSIIKLLAGIVGAEIYELALNNDIDTTDIVGGFEQVDLSRKSAPMFSALRSALSMLMIDVIRKGQGVPAAFTQLAEHLSATIDTPPITERLHRLLSQTRATDPATFASHIAECESLIAQAHEASIARFEWIDGMLVRAVEEGKWLVLDNANLCSPSVLDRLNSLLEPGGSLVVNEHSNENGEPKIVRPHPDFRLFITMDPRHGELSRAMRNRAVEVFVEATPMDDDERERMMSAKYSAPTETLASVYQSIERVLRTLIDDDDVYRRLSRSAFDLVPRSQAGFLRRWRDQVSVLLPRGLPEERSLDIKGAVDAASHLMLHPPITQLIENFLGFSSEKLGLEPSFIRVQTFYPLRNTSLLSTRNRTQHPINADVFARTLAIAKAVFEVRKKEEVLLEVQNQINLKANKGSLSFGDSFGMHLLGFLSTVRALLERWVNEEFHDWRSMDTNGILRIEEIISLWLDIFQSCLTMNPNESVFHVYLTLLENWVRDAHGALPASFVNEAEAASRVFRAPLKLTTGVSMEAIWNATHPSVPRTIRSWDKYLGLLAIMDRFDSVAGMGDLQTVTRLRSGLIEAVKAVIRGVEIDGLIKDLDSTIAQLEASSPEGSTEYRGNLTVQFDLLLKTKLLSGPKSAMGGDVATAAHFAQRSTRNLLALQEEAMGLRVSFEQILEDFWKYPKDDELLRSPTSVLDGRFGVEMLRSSDLVKESVIGRLGQLDTELQELARLFANSTTEVTGDSLLHLNLLLLSKLVQIITIHGDCYGKDDYIRLLSEFGELEGALKGQEHSSFASLADLVLKTDNISLKVVVDDHLVPIIKAIGGVPSFPTSGAAWVHYAMGCLKLYVPNVAFDPAMKPMIERQRYLQRKTEFSHQLEAEKVFELKFTGQDGNVEITRLERRLQDLGQEPPNSFIARPEPSQTSALQGEFSNLLQVIVRSEPHKRLLPSIIGRKENYATEEALFQRNLTMIVERLKTRYPIYKDIVDPVLGFIYSLKLGFSLAAMSTGKNGLDSAAVNSLLIPIPRDPAPAEVGLTWSDEMKLLTLWQFAARSSTEGYENLDSQAKLAAHSIFQDLFQQWKTEIIEAQEKSASDSSLYHYKGESENADEEEFSKMFPDYEKEEAEPQQNLKRSHQELSCQISHCHAALFTGNGDIEGSLHALIRRGTSIFIAEGRTGVYAGKLQDSLPAIILSLKDTSEWIRGCALSKKPYDFYTHENLAEAQRVVAIVEKTRRKLASLLRMWPENITLQDSMEACQQILDFPNITPVAKFLTKAEKLHGILDEWQKVARASDSAIEHYNALTQLIISWRKLELQAWPRLFDLEDEKCRLDANAWWFFLYENIVANPLSLLAEGHKLKEHVKQLISGLITFLESSSVGQLHYRLQLLRAFEHQLSYMGTNIPAMEQVRSGIHNFIVYYSYYEPLAKDILLKERKRLEVEVKDVILLASWKDINITALRESARRSHVKLYKVVRKYRQALDNPATTILQGSMPEAAPQNRIVHRTDTQLVVNFELVKRIYETNINRWDRRPARLQDIFAAAGTMQRVAKPLADTLNASEYLERFSANILATIEQLQSETPLLLNEENKNLVKHLKTRKRKAFVDVLKELRQMGLKSNINSATLQKQATLEAVLASAVAVEDGKAGLSLASVQYYFIRILELMTKVRKGMHEHSDDLKSPEVARSVGYLEHLLSLCVEQRQVMVSAAAALHNLHWSVEQYELLSKLESQETHLFYAEESCVLSLQDAGRVFKWLPHMLDLSIKVLRAHTEFSHVAFDATRTALEEFKFQSMAIKDRFIAEKRVHDNIWQSSTKGLIDDANRCLASIRACLADVSARTPEIAYTVRQLVPWTRPLPITFQKNKQSTTLQQLDLSLQNLCDAIFVAMQTLKDAQSSYPLGNMEDNAGWLLKHQSASAASLEALHIPDVTRRISAIITQASQLGSYTPESSLTIRALFAAYFPLVQKYDNICGTTVQQVALDHRAACKTTYILCSSAATLLSKGFCMPSEKSEEGGETGALEQGTGLGDGEGAEDISKDIGADEDLSEMAQEQNNEERQDDIEEEEDAVDMGQDDMQGEMGDKERNGDDEEGSENGEENDIDEETGEVDDLDPSAVDEKLWGEKGEDDVKEKEGQANGKQNLGEDMKATKEEDKGQNDENKDHEEGAEEDEQEGEEEGADQDDEVRQQDMEGIDNHVPEVDTLELPDDLNLDGDEKSAEEDEDGDRSMEDISDIMEEDETTKDGKPQEEDEAFPELDAAHSEDKPDETKDEEMEEGDKGEEGADGEEDEPMDDDEGPDMPQEPGENLLRTRDDKSDEVDKTAPSDTQAAMEGEGDPQEQNEQASAQKETGEATKAGEAPLGRGEEEAQPEEQMAGQASAEEFERSQAPQAKQEEDRGENPFRKVGDVLEKWHQQRRQILDAKGADEQRPHLDKMELDDAEFEHLPDEETAADTQALGTATEEQVQTLDESMAVDSGKKEIQDAFEDDAPAEEEPPAHQDAPKSREQEPVHNTEDQENMRAGAIVGQAKESTERWEYKLTEDAMDIGGDPREHRTGDDDMLETSSDPAISQSVWPHEEARRLWQKHEAATRGLSAGLCEQLRLILEPTLATKMRGDFRTGKRLNMKRIIPYIASSYKKDKIWMRRAKPSKRQYQVILAVDDSKSMSDSSSSDLALETVALIARALSSLEVGQISVLSFGDTTRIIHPFDRPFTAESGVDTFARFMFNKEKTDVRHLVETSLSLFEDARAAASSSPADLWQLEIIISDALCQDHDSIRRMLRRAQEQRVMLVFVIVDKLKGSSILDLTTVKFVNGEVVREHYIDTFPFAYYLVVSDVRELPGVLSGALRQWFAESVEKAG